MENKELFQNYEDAVKAIVKVFTDKNEISTSSWVGDIVGELLDIGGGYVIDFRDIILDIRENAPKGELKKWFDYRFRIYTLNTMANMAVLKDMNYHAWIHNAPRYSEEVLKNIETKWEKLKQEHGDIVKDMQTVADVETSENNA